ncbi:hypothetical protein [Thiolapillus sp.]|uniref:hypothetical protein n=5 Tax=Thiolapillus sp. TaxID=2017437 RepID=UPI003AF6FDB7
MVSNSPPHSTVPVIEGVDDLELQMCHAGSYRPWQSTLGSVVPVNDKRVFDLVIDFGTSQPPKSSRPLTTYLVPQPSWSPSTTQQLRKLVAAPYLPSNDWTPRLNVYFAYPLALCARRVSSAASRLLGSTSLRFALHGWQRGKFALAGRWWHLHSDINAWWREDCGVFCWFWYSSSTGHCSVLDC